MAVTTRSVWPTLPAAPKQSADPLRQLFDRAIDEALAWRERAWQRPDRQFGQHANDAGPVRDAVARGEADACACGNEFAVGELIVGAQCELFTRDRRAQSRKAAQDGLVAVVAYQSMAQQIAQLARRSGAL